jgi:hypothetical protein
MPRNNLHSFTLWPKSSEIVRKIKRGRKSQFVSKAIIWYDSPAGEQAQQHQKLIERYRESQIKIAELEKIPKSFIYKMRNKWSK